MNETTSLIFGNDRLRSTRTEEKESKVSWKLQASTIGLLAILGSCLLFSSPPATPLPDPIVAAVEPSSGPIFVLSVDQKIQLWEYWKDFLNWKDVWDHAKETWNKAQDQAQDAWDHTKEQNMSDHTRIWANQTMEQGKKWWDHAQDYYNNLTDAVYVHIKQKHDEHSKKQLSKVEDLIYMNHSDVLYLLLSNGDKGPFDYSTDYFLINQGHDAQINQAYCGVASSVAILNSLRGLIALPEDPVYHPYPYATQQDVFNECTDANVIVHNDTFDGILSAPFGLNLDATRALLQCHLPSDQWNTDAVHVDATISPGQLRGALKDALQNPDARVLINYHRGMAGQVGGGHFSPLGAYSPVLDAFLIMDVAKYKYPSAWIRTERLYQALFAMDHCGIWDGPTNQASMSPELLHPNSMVEMQAAMDVLGCRPAPRGYIIVSRK